MKYVVSFIVLVALAVVSCQSTPPSTTPTYENGLPRFDSPAEAIAFAVQEANFDSYKGITYGSEYYEITLPSGEVTNNWQVDSYFNALFRSFGTEAFDELAPLLAHEDEFVQVGAYSILNSYMSRHGLRRHANQSESEPLATLERLQLLLEADGV